MADHARPDDKTELSLGKVLVLLAVQAVAFVAAGLGLWSLSGREPENFLTFSPSAGLQGVVLGGALILAGWLMFTRLPEIADRLVRLQADTYRFLGPRLPRSAIVIIAICAGVGEEALFRGGLQVLLGDYIGAAAAIAVTSATFAAFHLGKPVITALLLVIGLVFGAVYWFTGSLAAVMIGHILYDIWALRYLHDSFLRLGLVKQPTAAEAAEQGADEA